MATEEEIRSIVEAFVKLEDEASGASYLYLKAAERNGNGTVVSTDFNNGKMTLIDGTYADSYVVRLEDWWNYGGHEIHSEEIPLSMLWAPDETVATTTAMLKAHKETALAQEIARMRERDKKEEETERKEFLRLKVKFGDV